MLLRDRTALSQHETTTAVDRYISCPGPALSYNPGEIAIAPLRPPPEASPRDRPDTPALHSALRPDA